MKKIMMVIAGLVLFSLVWVVWSLNDLFGPCEEKIIIAAVSPDERYLATFNSKNCGATTAQSYLVLVIAKFSKENFQTTFLRVSRGYPEITLDWLSPTTLRISCKGCDEKEISTKVAKDIGVTAVYNFKK